MAGPVGFITKVLPPKRRKELVRRQRLLDFLHQSADLRAVTITAPAGFGKTTMMVDYSSDVEMPVCWLSLDESDRSPRRFLTYFVAALQERFPEFGARTLGQMEATPQVEGCYEDLVGTLVTEVFQTIPDYFSLVLDDYHEVAPSQPITSILDLLLRRLPDNCQLVFLSRTPVALPVLSRLTVERKAATLTAEDLRLAPEESRELLSLYRSKLKADEIEYVIAQAKGWIPGLLLAEPCSEASGGAISNVPTGTESLFAYLAGEVLERERPEVQEFLSATSVLPDLRPKVCDALLGIGDSSRLLEELETRQFFLTKIGNQTCYQYHPLLKQFLLGGLQSEHPGKALDFSLKAARLLREQGEFEEAWRLFMKVGSHEEAADTAERAAQTLFEKGRWSTLADMIDQVPAPAWWGRPTLLLWRAWIGIRLGDTKGPLTWADRALQLCRERSDGKGVTRALIARSAALRIKGLADDAIASGEEALLLIQRHGGEPRDLADAQKHLGIGHGQKGEFAKASTHLEAALKHYELAEDLYNTSLVSESLGVAFQRMGQLSRAAAYYERARQGYAKLDNKGALAEVLNNLGYLHYWSGQQDLAREAVSRSLSLAESAGSLKVQAAASITLGDLERDAGRVEEALNLYGKALELARAILEPYLVAQATEALGCAYLLAGELDKAEVLVEQALAQAKTRQNTYEEALFSLSRGMLLNRRGGFPQAEQALAAAMAGLEASGDRQPLARAYFQMAACLIQQRRYGEVAMPLEKAADLARALGSWQFLVPEASQVPRLLRYAEAKGLGAGLYSDLLAKVRTSVGTQPAHAVPADLSPYPRVEAYALGETRVLVDGQEIKDLEWRSTKSKEMFFFLLSNRRKHSREEILDALWPELRPAKARSTFHSTAFRLRRALYPDSVLQTENSYWLNPEGDYWYDAEEFQRLVSEAERLPKGSGVRARKLEEAVALYRGAFLKDFYSEWSATLARELERQYLKSLALLAGYHAARGEYEQSVSLLEMLLSTDPYDEEAYLQLMKAHVQRGEPALARHCYRRYERVVREDLGSRPAAKLLRLFGETNDEEIPPSVTKT